MWCTTEGQMAKEGRSGTIGLCVRDKKNIRDALENHDENKNKDLSSTICEFVSLQCTPQVRYICGAETRIKETAETTI